ncbi:MAG TPA: class I SAM-dependent methyltransferase, partial [Bdellovibrionota bacterium]|nr:class I SAM-dependent methyltransferase [Bdellovibrionota bacterium]
AGISGRLSKIYSFHSHLLPPLLPKKGVALDLGCGSGVNLLHLAHALPEWEFHGVELSETMLDLAKDLSNQSPQSVRKRIKLHQGDIRNCFNDSSYSFDLITCCYTLHHLPTIEDVRETLSTLERLSKPDGAIYLFDFSRPTLKIMEYFWGTVATIGYHPLLRQEFKQSLKASWHHADLKGLLPDGTSLYPSGLHFLAYRPHEKGRPLNIYSRLALYLPIRTVDSQVSFIRGLGGKKERGQWNSSPNPN